MPKDKEQGFTLVELLIVMFVIGLLAALVVVSLRKSNVESNLRFATQNLVSVLKQAQTMSFAGKTAAGDEVPEGGYGVYLNSRTSYILFADNNGNGTYNGGAEQVETINLPAKIEFFEGGGPVVGSYIVFLPPNGSMDITHPTLGKVGDLTITLTIDTDLTQTKGVYVSKESGLIEMQE